MLPCFSVDWLTVSARYNYGSDIYASLCRLGDGIEEHGMSRVWINNVSVYRTRSLQHKLFTLSWGSRTPVLAVDSCRLQLSNSGCYGDYYKLIMSYCVALGLRDIRVSRVDLARDFTQWDYSGSVSDFCTNLVAGLIRPVHTTKWHVFGDSKGEDHRVTGATWGVRTSFVYCRLYDKMAELAVTKSHKPYLHAKWLSHGWDGVSSVWRLEFEVKKLHHVQGSVRIGNRLSDVSSHNVSRLWWGLLNHYGSFRLWVPGKRFARCPDVTLWQDGAMYEPLVPIVDKKNRIIDEHAHKLRQHIRDYMNECEDENIRAACVNLLNTMATSRWLPSVSNTGVEKPIDKVNLFNNE